MTHATLHTDKPSNDKPSIDKSSADKANTHKVSTDKAYIDSSSDDMPKTSLLSIVTSWFNPLQIGHSLPTRAWAAVAFITLVIGVLGMASLTLSKVAQMDAQAINQAGSVRMATQRINHELTLLSTGKSVHYDVVALDKDMNERLMALHHYQSLSGNDDKLLNEALSHIDTMWQHELKPLLLEQNSEAFYVHSQAYLQEVDAFVLNVQQRSEVRGRYQIYLHLGSLCMIIAIMLFGMYELNKNALTPLQNLTNTARHYNQGTPANTASNMMVRGYKELNDLSEAFLQMLAIIDSYQARLESDVAQKTLHLTQANKALYTLYDFAQTIATTHLNSEELQDLIKKFTAILPNSEISLCLHGQEFDSNTIVSLSSHEQHSFCTPDDCEQCDLKTNSRTRTIAIASEDTVWGELLVNEPITEGTDNRRIRLVDDDSLSEADLLSTLAHLISLAFISSQHRKQEQELVLAEERNTLARELHDSIAQSLSYLKIQASMLKTLGDTEKTLIQNEFGDDHELIHLCAKQDKVREEIKSGLNHVYSQLRDLLVTFRLRIDGGDFNEALVEAVQEFSTKGGFGTNFDNQVLTLNLSAAEQVDILQILREALSNIYKHAHASHVNVLLYQDSRTYEVVLIVQDDGIGIAESDKQKQGHHGLSTMNERALNLGGTLTTETAHPKASGNVGTQVTARFLPQFFVKKTKVPRPKPALNAWSDDTINELTDALSDELNELIPNLKIKATRKTSEDSTSSTYK